jgi:hypothetical protein
MQGVWEDLLGGSDPVNTLINIVAFATLFIGTAEILYLAFTNAPLAPKDRAGNFKLLG